MKGIFLTSLLFTSVYWAIAQKTISGVLLEEETKKPIPFANIGILNSTIGTLSNEDGSFLVRIPADLNNDTLIFSALGYARKDIPVKQLMDNTDIILYLNQKDIVLQEVTIQSKTEKKKQFELGNRYSKGGVNLCSSEEASAGASVALLIQNANPSYHKDLRFPATIGIASLKVAENKVGDFKVRVRVYDVNPTTGGPGNDLLNESIILHSKINSGWLDFDLSRFNLVVDGPFFIAYEWILDKAERETILEAYRNFEKQFPERVSVDTTIVDGKKIPTVHYINFQPGTSFGVSLLPISLSNYKTFSRNHSLSEWKRTAYVLTTRVEVSNQSNK